MTKEKTEAATIETAAGTETAQQGVIETAAGTETAQQGVIETAAGTETAQQGVRARRAFMLKQFLPNQDWINKNIVAGGKGTRALVGRVYGVATGYETKTNTLPDGSVSTSIALNGVFRSDGYLTGEQGESTSVYFPMAYAEKVKTAFDTDPEIKAVEVDCDIGLEATGKTIPYEWVVVAFREGEEMAVLKRIANSRPRPTAQALLTALGGDAKALPSG